VLCVFVRINTELIWYLVRWFDGKVEDDTRLIKRYHRRCDQNAQAADAHKHRRRSSNHQLAAPLSVAPHLLERALPSRLDSVEHGSGSCTTYGVGGGTFHALE
jgi:hypothetical protein